MTHGTPPPPLAQGTKYPTHPVGNRFLSTTLYPYIPSPPSSILPYLFPFTTTPPLTPKDCKTRGVTWRAAGYNLNSFPAAGCSERPRFCAGRQDGSGWGW
eukprot:765612-Hanusia_phi.AAC.2